jgi:subtilisin family serine protease
MNSFVRLIAVGLLAAFASSAQQRFIVRTTLGEALLKNSCASLGCKVVGGLGDPGGQVFLITIANTLNAGSILSSLTQSAGVSNSEIDQITRIAAADRTIPDALYRSESLSYFGSTVRFGYVYQPAVSLIRLMEVQSAFGVTGAAIVAVIDTGVDPDHPALRNVLLSGYDFTRGGIASASEKADVTQSTAAVVDGVPPLFVNANAAAVVDQSTAAVVDDPDHSRFGHGTMVTGIIHLVAPQARILPLKAFKADGTGYASDILRSVYTAVRSKARVVNMSFSMPMASPELKRAVDHAVGSGAVCVASVGNNGVSAPYYPAAFDNVIGVASTTNGDARSSFSNYGSSLVFVAAPGEGIVTTYPFATFAAGWGTSFSAPFVSGTVALLLQARANLTVPNAQNAIAHARALTQELGHGRLDIFQAVEAANTQSGQ